MKKYIAFFLLLALIGCKPKQIINDRIVTETDSTAIWTLKEVIAQQWQEIDRFKATSDRLREENARLQSETQRHEINYDTKGEIKDGKYPVSSEITTTSKSVYESKIKDQQNLIQEYDREVRSVTQRNLNLEYQLDHLKSELKELKSKPVRSFHFKSFMYGIIAGIIIAIILIKI